MGMSVGGGGGGKLPTALSEINVTPLVDVMLVLLIIFMITASMETVRAEQEQELAKEEQLKRLEELEINASQKQDQQVPINLPKVNSEQVNLTEEKKLVLSLDQDLVFWIGTTAIARCHELAPTLKKELADSARTAQPGQPMAVPEGFRTCLKAVEEKLLENEKLQRDGELYLRADRTLDYGMVLMTMARIRKAGVTKFGLVAEPDLEE